MKVHIHLGAQKTATTFIQHWLTEHHRFLRGADVAYVGVHHLRRVAGFHMRALLAKGDAAGSEDFLALRRHIQDGCKPQSAKLDKARVLLLSEENFLGSLHDYRRDGVLYKDLRRRLSVLRRVFDGHDVRFFLSVRDYAGFYCSAYAEMVRGGYSSTFSEYLDHLRRQEISWRSILEELIAGSGGAVTWWRYEDFRRRPQAVLSALADAAVPPRLLKGKEAVRPSMSEPVLRTLVAARKVLNAQEHRQLADHLYASEPFGPDAPRLRIDDDAFSQALSARYAQDLAGLPGALSFPD